jgi:hypothetical protein
VKQPIRVHDIRIADLENALRKIVSEFETDFMLDGVIVDDPPISMICMYEIAIKGLGKTPIYFDKVT